MLPDADPLSPELAPFAGSYASTAEVGFLMRQLSLKPIALEERERQIQSGQRHYSEMIGPEDAPSRQRLKLFRECLAANGQRLAEDIARLAAALAASVNEADNELTIISLARAGTPIGALLWHRLRATEPRLRLAHYSISIIRDRGIDTVALAWILARHSPQSLRFVDGWTGKGTIAHELQRALAAWPARPASLSDGLWVPLDVCGVAAFAASATDYLIPSTLLGGTISGLISRSVLPAGEEGSLHGCVPLEHLRRYDLTRWFVQHLSQRLAQVPHQPLQPTALTAANASGGPARQAETQRCLLAMLQRTGLTDRNRIKLGIGETVRVLLRRLPERVLLSRHGHASDAAMIQRLAALRGVPVETEDSLAFDAIVIIGTAR